MRMKKEYKRWYLPRGEVVVAIHQYIRGLTKGNKYIVLQTLKSRLGTPWVLVLNDDGEQTSYDASYFRKLKEVANGEVKS
jgi:hypothetical protein